MNLHNLPSITENSARRLGRGHGSGRGKTSGRGTKGQKARRDIPLSFEGGALTIIKRLPFLRGRGKNKVLFGKPFVINLRDLSDLPAKTVVDEKFLIDKKIISKDVLEYGVKLLGQGDIKTELTIKIPASKNAIEKIKKAGGLVEV